MAATAGSESTRATYDFELDSPERPGGNNLESVVAFEVWYVTDSAFTLLLGVGYTMPLL